MSQTVCLDDEGRSHAVPAASLTARPAVYGFLLEGEQVLLRRHENGRHLPVGRLLRRHEPLQQALRLHFRTSAGFTPAVRALLDVETAYYLDPAQQAWQLSRFYYLVERPLSGRMLPLADNAATRPHWIPLADLTRESLQFGWDALQLAQAQTQSRLAGR